MPLTARKSAAARRHWRMCRTVYDFQRSRCHQGRMSCLLFSPLSYSLAVTTPNSTLQIIILGITMQSILKNSTTNSFFFLLPTHFLSFFPLSPSLSHALYFFKISLNPQTHWFLKFFFPGENQINSVLFPYNEKISYICKRVILMELFLAKQKYSGSLSSCREFRDMVKIENTISILPWDD